MSNSLFKDWETNRFKKYYRVWSTWFGQFGYIPKPEKLTQEQRSFFSSDDTLIYFRVSDDEVATYTLDELVSSKQFIITAATGHLDKCQRSIYEGDILVDVTVKDDSPDTFQVMYSRGQDCFCLYRYGACVYSWNHIPRDKFEVRGNIFEIQKLFPNGNASVSLVNLKTDVRYYLPRLTYEGAEKIRDYVLSHVNYENGNWGINIDYMGFKLLTELWPAYLSKLPEDLIAKIEEARGGDDVSSNY